MDRGGLVVDGSLRTSDPDVYAIGDVAAFPLLRAGGGLVRQEHVTHCRWVQGPSCFRCSVRRLPGTAPLPPPSTHRLPVIAGRARRTRSPPSWDPATPTTISPSSIRVRLCSPEEMGAWGQLLGAMTARRSAQPWRSARTMEWNRTGFHARNVARAHPDNVHWDAVLPDPLCSTDSGPRPVPPYTSRPAHACAQASST